MGSFSGRTKANIPGNIQMERDKALENIEISRQIPFIENVVRKSFKR